MNPLDRDVQQLMRMIEAAGGKAGVMPGAPDWVKRAFIDMIHECPDCQEELSKKWGRG